MDSYNISDVSKYNKLKLLITMKKRRYLYCIIYLMLFVLVLGITCLLSACSETGKNEQYGEAYSIDQNGLFGTFSDNGVFFTRAGIVKLFDPETGIYAPICSKVNCSHQGSSLQNQHPSCDAYLGQAVGYSAVIGKYLYYVATPDDLQGASVVFTKEFYRADKDGTERKLLYKADDIMLSTVGVYENGYFLYGYYNQENPAGEALDKNELGMCVINLKTEEVTRIRIDEQYSGQILGMTLTNGNLYYEVYYTSNSLKDLSYEDFLNPDNKEAIRAMGRSEVWKYDMSTGANELLFKRDGSNGRLGLKNGWMYYTDDSERNHYVRKLEDGKEYKLPEQILKSPCLYKEGILFMTDGKAQLWKYGTEELEILGYYPENELINIQFVGDKWIYAVRYYDGGYDDLFFARKDFMKGILAPCKYDIKE